MIEVCYNKEIHTRMGIVMKKKNVFNLAIGIFVILQSIFFPINFMTPILFILVILNLFIFPNPQKIYDQAVPYLQKQITTVRIQSTN